MDNRFGQIAYDPRAVRTGGMQGRTVGGGYSRRTGMMNTTRETAGTRTPDGTGRQSCGCKNNPTEQSPLMRRLQELDLALIDTGLYLDAYPDNREALCYFKRLGEERERVLAEYERQYGPMTLSSAGETDGSWDWISQPWPWETWEVRETRKGCTPRGTCGNDRKQGGQC